MVGPQTRIPEGDSTTIPPGSDFSNIFIFTRCFVVKLDDYLVYDKTVGRDEDIRDIRNAESRRGSRRPGDTKEKARRKQLEADARKAIDDSDVERLKNVMRSAGIEPGSARWEAALRLWFSEHAGQ